MAVVGRDLYGAEHATLRLWKELAPERVQVTAVILEHTDHPSDMLRAARELGDQVPVHAHRASGPVAFRIFLLELLASHPADVICTVGYKCDLYCAAALRGVSIPQVSVMHGWVDTSFKLRFYNWLDRQCLRRLDGIFTVAGHLEREAKALNRAGRVACLRNGVDVVGLQAAAQPPPEEWPSGPTLLFVGRLAAEKGLRHLVDAVAMIPGVHLVLVGSGPLEDELRAQATTRELGDRIHFAGFQPNAAPWIAAADMLALPSYTEGLPLVLLEAMALDTPVIASRVGGIPDLLGEDICGLLIPPGDTAALTAAIERLLAEPELAGQLAKRARRRVESEYTEALVARRFEDSLHEWFGHG